MAIVADLGSGKSSVYTASAHQYDTGQKLIITGIELPESYEVHISNSKNSGMAFAYTGDSEGVVIPDAYFLSGEYIYAWVYTTENAEGKTLCEITIPIIKRAGRVLAQPSN